MGYINTIKRQSSLSQSNDVYFNKKYSEEDRMHMTRYLSRLRHLKIISHASVNLREKTTLINQRSREEKSIKVITVGYNHSDMVLDM